MKKFFCTLICLLLSSVCLLSGCNLVQINAERNLNKVIASAGEVTVNKEELINGYYNFGYQYVQNYGYSQQDALELTAEYLLNRKLVINYSKTTYGELTQTEKNNALQETYDYINEQVKALEETIREELGLDPIEESEEESSETTYQVETPYEKKIVKENGQYVIVTEAEETDVEPLGDFELKHHGNEEVCQKAFNRYLKNLINNDTDKDKATTNEEALEKEIDRVYKTYEENEYISRLEKKFEENQNIDEINSAIVNKFVELVGDSYAKYVNDLTAYNTQMQSDASSVYYHPYDDQNGYVRVAHILIKYSDEQTALIKEYESDLKQGYITKEQYEQKINKLAEEIKGYLHVDGEDSGEAISYKTIYQTVKQSLDVYGTDLQKRSEEFNKLIYMYNQDPGMFNATNYYVVNLNEEVTDKMVKPFADTARALYESDKQKGLEGGGIELVLSEYGYHIIFNAGLAKNIGNIDIKNLNNVTADLLYDTRIMEGTAKTYYDAMYDLITKTSYDNYQTALINTLKHEVEIVYNYNEFKDMF